MIQWGFGGGLVRLVRKLATNDIHPLIDRFSLTRSMAEIVAGDQSRIINPGESRVSHLVDVKLSMGAAAALDAIWTRYRQGHPCRPERPQGSPRD